MYTALWEKLRHQSEPIDVTVVGLGFMGFGFLSNVQRTPGVRVGLLITRRPDQAVEMLLRDGYGARAVSTLDQALDAVQQGLIAVTDDLELMAAYPNNIVFEVTGTVAYGTEVALAAVAAGKHLVTMNPELQATVGTALQSLFDQAGLIFTDVIGDQPGSLARLVASSQMKGFKPLLAGNMKRYMDHHATQAQMQPWADDKGLAVRQTVSFTDGTKQSIEMTLVANHFGMGLIQEGMVGPQVEKFDQVLESFNWDYIPETGVVDFMIGRNLFPGVFLVAEHTDPHQQKYLRYLNMGDGPRYVLFDSYHLCHLEALETILGVAWFNQSTISNGVNPTTATVALAKTNLKPGMTLDGIGGDLAYGTIRSLKFAEGLLPMGLSAGAVVTAEIAQDEPIPLSAVKLPNNAATRLLGLV